LCSCSEAQRKTISDGRSYEHGKDTKIFRNETVSKKIRAAASWTMKENLHENLRDPVFAAEYVNEALLEGDEVVFKTAVADVIRARGVGKVAAAAGINRVTVFKTLKPETRTSFTTYHSLLTACGIDFATRPIRPKARSRPVR
jgi:probable addiction module antidote protein